MSNLSFNDYYTYAMYIAIFGVVLCLLIFFWPQKKWVTEENKISEEEAVSGTDRKEAIFRILTLFLVVIGLAAAMILFGSMPVPFSVIVSVALVMMVFPTVRTIQESRRQRQGRMEALAFAEYIAGRMSAQAPLFEAIENLQKEFVEGKRDLQIVGDDLGEVVRRVRLGTPLEIELDRLQRKYESLNSLKYIFTSYKLMVEAEMGQEAEIYQANDLSESQTISDELANTLETEMATATMSRVVMFLLIGGMIAFLIFFGEGLGDVLINTLPGNGIIGFSLFCLYLAQTIGSKLEELPILEF